VTAASQRFLVLEENPLRAIHMSLEALVHVIVPGRRRSLDVQQWLDAGRSSVSKAPEQSLLVVGQLATGNEQGGRLVTLP
jgi:hypothetical protein